MFFRFFLVLKTKKTLKVQIFGFMFFWYSFFGIFCSNYAVIRPISWATNEICYPTNKTFYKNVQAN